MANDPWANVNLPSAPTGKNSSGAALKAGGFDNAGILDWANEIKTKTASKQAAKAQVAADPGGHVFQSPEAQANITKGTSTSPWANFIPALGDMAKSLVPAQDMGGTAGTVGGKQVPSTIPSKTATVLNAVPELPKALTQTAYGAFINPFLQAAAQIGKATGHSGKVNLPKALNDIGLPNTDSFSNQVEQDMANGMPTYQAIIKQIPNIIGAGLMLDAIATPSVLKLSESMQEKTSTPITFKDMQNITTGKLAAVDPEVLQAYKQAAAENPGLLGQIRKGTVEVPNTPKATLFSNFLKNAATRPMSEIGNIFDTFGKDINVTNTKLLSAPFSHETPPITVAEGGAIEAFAHEPGGVDITHEPFTGQVYNRLPDKVVQVVDFNGKSTGRFYTIPVDQAHTIINSIDGTEAGIAGKNVNGESWHVTAKSPSQMEARGFTNAGPITPADVPTIGPETSTALATTESGLTPAERELQAGQLNIGKALEDIKSTIQSFKDNSASKQEGIRLRTNFTGNRDARIAADNQLFSSLEHLMKNPLDQEALSLFRPFKDDPAALQQFLEGTHPEYQKVADEFLKNNPDAKPPEIAAVKQAAIERVKAVGNVIKQALSPNASMRAVDIALTDYSKNKLTEGQSLGILDSKITPQNYVPQHTLPIKETLGGKIKRVAKGQLGSKFQAAQERVFSSPLHALAWGAKPKTLNVFTNFSIYAEGYATAAATKEFLTTLADNKLAQFQGGNAPANWETVLVGKKQVWVPKEIAETVKPLIEKGTWAPGKVISNLNVYQQYLKAVEVSLSIFHAKALALTATADIGPAKAATVPFIDMESDAFKQQELDFIRDGGQTSILGKTIEAHKLINESSLPSRGAALKSLPIAKQLVQLSDKITKLTFDIQQRAYKVISYSTKKAGWLGKHPNATPEEIKNAGIDIAKQVNAVYGGLNWESLGVGKVARTVARIFAFAPDWSWSNVLSAKYAFEGNAAGTASRSFWFKAIVGGLVASELASYAITKKFSKRPFFVFLGHDKAGKELYANEFFVGGPGDMIKWLQNVQDYGAVVGTAQTLGNKMQGLPRAVMHAITNKNFQGQDISIKGMSTIANTIRGVKQFGQDVLPIPFTGTAIYNLMTDPKNEAGFWDYLSNVGFAARVEHTIPEGQRQVPSGKKKGQLVPDEKASRPDLPIMQQVLTGKTKDPVPKKTKAPSRVGR